MSMSSHVVGFRPADEKWNKMKAIWDICKKHNVCIPCDVVAFFGGEYPSDKPGGEIHLGTAVREWRNDHASGFELDVSKLPKDLTIVRFYNSWWRPLTQHGGRREMKNPNTKLREPTADECSSNALIGETDEQVAYAIWYPQMGGYVSKAVVAFFKNCDESNPCFDVSVWHDGQFPFSDSDSGISVHHCDAQQFIDFGRTVLRLQGMDDDETGEQKPPRAEE